MAGKRAATSELNADNWDQEEEQEDAGVFKRAPEDVLKNRVVKTARRRVPAADVSDIYLECKKNFFQFYYGL